MTVMVVIAIPGQDSDDWSEHVLAVRWEDSIDGGRMHADLGDWKDASLVTKSDQMMQLSEKERTRVGQTLRR